MRNLGVHEWNVQCMYSNAKRRVRVNNSFSNEFEVEVGAHQSSVPRHLLFIIVLEALSCELRKVCPWEFLYTDDLVIMAESEEEL